MQIIEDGYGGMDDPIDESVEIITMLIDLVYSLAPDEEFEELYDLKAKIAKAEDYIESLEGVV